MWRLVKLGYRAEPRLLVFAFAHGAVRRAARRAARAVAGAARAGRRATTTAHSCSRSRRPASASRPSATWFLRGGRRSDAAALPRPRDDLPRVARRAPAGVGADHRAPRAARLPRPPVACCATRCSRSTTCTCRCSRRPGWILRLGVTVVLLVSVSPCADPARRCSRSRPCSRRSWRPGVERAVEEGVASRDRLARHLFLLGTTAPPGKEVRLERASGPASSSSARAAWERLVRAGRGARRWSSAFWHTIAWAIFGGAYVGAVVFVDVRCSTRRSRPCCSCSPPGSRLSQYVGATVGEIGFLRGIWLDGARRLAWLEDYARRHRRARRSARARAHRGRHPPRTRLVPLSRAPTGSCSTTSTSTSPPARWSRSSARTARASRRS